MSKFKIKMKIQGFELEIEGSREDVPLISQNIGAQITSLLKPAGAIVEGELIEDSAPPAQHALPLQQVSAGKKSTSRRRPQATAAATNDGGVKLDSLDWRHDSAKYAMPNQDWTTGRKGLWILYVVQEELKVGELSAGAVERTFNKHFRQSGAVRASNVSRDFGQMKTASPSLVAEDTTKTPSAWYLTNAGRQLVQGLIAEGLTKTA